LLLFVINWVQGCFSISSTSFMKIVLATTRTWYWHNTMTCVPITGNMTLYAGIWAPPVYPTQNATFVFKLTKVCFCLCFGIKWSNTHYTAINAVYVVYFLRHLWQSLEPASHQIWISMNQIMNTSVSQNPLCCIPSTSMMRIWKCLWKVV